MKGSKAILGITPEVYYIDKDVLNFLNYTYHELRKADEILIGVGMQYFGKVVFSIITIDGFDYEWQSGGIMPSPYDIDMRDIQHLDTIKNLTEYQRDVLYKLIDGTYICSVSYYKMTKESYIRRTRENKLNRITK